MQRLRTLNDLKLIIQRLTVIMEGIKDSSGPVKKNCQIVVDLFKKIHGCYMNKMESEKNGKLPEES